MMSRGEMITKGCLVETRDWSRGVSEVGSLGRLQLLKKWARGGGGGRRRVTREMRRGIEGQGGEEMEKGGSTDLDKSAGGKKTLG